MQVVYSIARQVFKITHLKGKFVKDICTKKVVSGQGVFFLNDSFTSVMAVEFFENIMVLIHSGTTVYRQQH